MITSAPMPDRPFDTACRDVIADAGRYSISGGALRCLVAHLAECDSQYYAASGELVVAITNETIAETTGLDPWSVTRYRIGFREIGLFVALNDKGTGRLAAAFLVRQPVRR